ncbi:MAG: hypothetical protein K6T68_01645 [Alicyclobacillus shizuokensis]|nr:hypothetical protein [Alicyclobacillus shizuokensis]
MTTLRSRILFTVGASLLLAITAPVYAAEPTEYSALSDSKLLERYQKVAAGKNPDYCKALLPLLDEMTKREAFQQTSTKAKTLTEYQCAISEERYKDAYNLAGELEKITGIALPDESALPLAVIDGIRPWLVWVALGVGACELALARRVFHVGLKVYTSGNRITIRS